MKALKRLGLSAFFLLMSSMNTYCLPTLDVIERPLCRKVTSLLWFNSAYPFRRTLPFVVSNFVQSRHSSTYNNGGQENQIEKYESVLTQCRSLLQEVEKNMKNAVQHQMQPVSKAVESSSQSFMVEEEPKHTKACRTPAVIMPVNSRDSLFPSEHLRERDSSLEHKYVEALDNLHSSKRGELNGGFSSRTSFPRSRTQENTLQRQDIDAADTMQDDFIKKIMSVAKNIDKISETDVKTILNLYAALVHHPKDGISRVLNRYIDTSNSVIYNDVVAHAQLKGTDLETYRAIYVRLCDSFGEDAMRTIYQIAAKMMREREGYVLDLIMKSSTLNEYISVIVEGANPLYPVRPDEVNAIFELYSALTDIPRESITRVLSSYINTSKSLAYKSVISHISQQNSNLEIYRNIYGRLNKALDRESMRIIYQMVDHTVRKDDDKKQISLPNQVRTRQPDQDTSDDQSIENRFDDGKERDPELVDEEMDMTSPEMEEDTDINENQFVRTRDGKYSITRKEQERLNRIYDLLPQYHGRSVTSALSGSTTNKNLPIWGDLFNAIEQIRQDAIQAGDTTKIDLGYFRKLHWKSMRVTGKGGSRETSQLTVNKAVISQVSEGYNISKKKTTPKKTKSSFDSGVNRTMKNKALIKNKDSIKVKKIVNKK